MPFDYGFQSLTRADYPLLSHWLAQPHIGGWWGDGDTELALIEGDMVSGLTDMWLVTYQGTPFAYVQDYPAHCPEMPQYADFAAKARAMDTFLGDPAFLGKGHAAGYLRQRAGILHSRYGAVLVDPDPVNNRAIAAYAKAGFRAFETRSDEDGKAVLVMIYDPDTET